MKYLSKYISETCAEIIKWPKNPKDDFDLEKSKLDNLIGNKTYFSDEEIEEISIQHDILKNKSIELANYENLFIDGFLEFVPSEEIELQEGEKLTLSYKIENNKVLQIWKSIKDISFFEKKLTNLKNELGSSDYKIIRCYEANLLNKEPPYDINLLSEERQLIRDEINRIQEDLLNL